MKKWIKGVVLIGIATMISVPTLATTPIKLTYNGEVINLKQKPILNEERVFLPLRELGKQFDYRIKWEGKTKPITITHEETYIELNIDNKIAYINGEKVVLDRAPQMIGEVTYIPIRFVSEAFNKKVHWDQKEHTVSIIEKATYKVDSQTHELIKLEKGTKKVIGKIKVSHKGKIYITVQTTDRGHTIITVDNNYGEPGIIFDRTVFYLDEEKILGQTATTYRNRVCQNVHYIEDRVALTDGKKVYLYNDETGKLMEEYDLQKLVGEGHYEVEVSGKGFLLVREEQKGLLTLLDLDKKKITQIYEAISLSEAEKQYVLHGKEPTYDGITFEKKQGSALYFKYSGLEIRDGRFVYYMKK